MNLEAHKARTQKELIELINRGTQVKYVFFWGHTPPTDGSINKSCFSQWYNAEFKIDGILYPTAEHFMMAEKARLFNDLETVEKIIHSTDPHHAKKLGRLVKNYDDQKWKGHRFEAVVKGNLAKFNQNPQLAEFLKNTKNRVLVEASPPDRIWGIGLAADHPNASNPNQWRGLNLLGFALMEVREQLAII